MADLEKYSGASHFATESTYEVQRTHHFEVVIDALDEVSGDGKGYGEAFRLSVKKSSTPKISVETIELHHGNESVKVAAKPKYEGIQLDVYDIIGKDMQRILQDWFYKIFNPETHQMGLVRDYKKTATLYMFSPDSTIVRIWTLYGVFPTDISFSEFGADSNDVVTISLSLSVDKAVEAKITG